VAAGVIAAFPGRGWTALKITQYGHGICSRDGALCGCAPEEHPFSIDEEPSRAGTTDSSRFLAAGARRSLWVRTRQGQLEQAMPALRRVLDAEPNVIVESNSILRFIEPDLYLAVLSFAVTDFKATAREFLPRASAVIAVDAAPLEGHPWGGIPPAALEGIPLFRAQPPQYVTPELERFIAARL
jgi:hypothetical protein